MPDDTSAIARPRAASATLPWLITLPVAAGVFLGALILGLLVVAYQHGQENAAPGDVQGRVESVRSGDDAAPAAIALAGDRASAARAASLPRLPGLIEANRRRLGTACIGGTVGHRRSNGWVQAVASNAPRRCVATSQ